MQHIERRCEKNSETGNHLKPLNFSVIPISESVLDPDRKSPAYCAYPVPKEGTSAVVTDVGTGCGGRGSVVARFMRADERR
jgi:hypothetical protein